ncbi:phage tail assembly chaperone G [Paucisalibacillus globulus]|uniref:phage tail assembly chaperone G n=1 Tax=Paucisalibacillus globulus TaxID=351095 RepID=UPI0004098B48|nr:hypothetical protein [Paucisalibacillus globulus]
MKIELYIDGEKKIFTTPIVPMLAKRKYFEVMAKADERTKDDENYVPTFEEQLEEEAELVGILANIIFPGQFTVEQVFAGASDEYVYDKLREAVFGKSKKKNENDEGNNQGE